MLVSLKPRFDSSIGQGNNGSFKLVKSAKVSETPSGVPLDVCCKCR